MVTGCVEGIFNGQVLSRAATMKKITLRSTAPLDGNYAIRILNEDLSATTTTVPFSYLSSGPGVETTECNHDGQGCITYFRRAADVPLDQLAWRPSGQRDGRETVIFAIDGAFDASGQGRYLSSTTVGAEECRARELARPEGYSLAQAAWTCRWSEMYLGGLGSDGMTDRSGPIRLWRAEAGMTRADPNAPESQRAFTTSLVGTWVPPADSDAMSLGTVAPTPTTSLGSTIKFIVPLGRPSSGETKPHLYLHANNTTIATGAWSEARAYDCPRVLYDVDLDPGPATPLHPDGGPQAPRARRLHGAAAVRNCAWLRANCAFPPGSLPDDASTSPGRCNEVRRRHVTAEASWPIENRIYLAAPGPMTVIAAKGYWENFENRYDGQFPPLSGQDRYPYPEFAQFIVMLRFGAGQVMRLDHLAHTMLPFGAVSPSAGGTGINGFNDLATLPAGTIIGYVHRVKPYLGRANNNAGPVTLNSYGDAFDWGVADMLHMADAEPADNNYRHLRRNAFINQPRYDEQDGAIFQETMAPLLSYLHARCPYQYYGFAFSTAFDALLGQGGVPTSQVGACQRTMLVGSETRFTLRDVPGRIAGQWYHFDPNVPYIRSRPALAMSDEGANQVVISLERQASSTEYHRFYLGRCIGAPPPDMMCMDMGASAQRPEDIVFSASMAPVCYQSEANPLQHIRFVYAPEGAPTSSDPFTPQPEGLSVFFGNGACPSGAEIASTTPVGTETAAGKFVR